MRVWKNIYHSRKIPKQLVKDDRLLEANLIEMTVPDKSKSSKQKYRPLPKMARNI